MTCAIVLRAAGTNCDREAVQALELAGAETETVHVRRLIEEPALLDRCGVLMLPGGFSYGDDVASGKVLAGELQAHLADALLGFVERGGVVLGVCNGFQVLVKLGLLGAPRGGGLEQTATLTFNDSDRFECRWVRLAVTGGRSPLLDPGSGLELPVAHGEGKFVAPAATLAELEAAGQVVLRYASESGESPAGYPANPNGSIGDIAGICDQTGRVLGLMPHPERYVSRQHHPRWTRGAGRCPGDGLSIFRRAVEVAGC